MNGTLGTAVPVSTAMIRFLWRVFALFMVAGVGCTDSVGPEDEAGAPPGGIIFVSDRPGTMSNSGQVREDIYRIDADGTDVVNLTSEPAVTYRDLRLSPDGRTILFESDRVGCYNVWAMGLESLSAVQLTGRPGERCNEMPRWSPDGYHVAFTSSREPIERSWEAYVVDADGGDPRNVSDDAGLGDGGADWPHTWLPDGRLIFHHQKTGPPQTFVVNADGTGRAAFLEGQAGYAPFFSPDGSMVAFMSEWEGNPEIYVMNADGTGIRNLTNDPGEDTFWHGSRANLFVDPWSPDGTLLAFTSDRSGNREIYVIQVEGSGLHNMTNDPAEDRFSGWSPNGEWIAFESDRDGPWHIFAVNLERDEPWQITEGSTNDWNAIWVGDGA